MEFKERVKNLAVICFAIAFVITLILIFSSKVKIGFFGYIAFLISATFFTSVAVVIGDAFCRFTKPDMFMSSGAVDTFKQKIFWKVGPQSIGWFIGYMATTGFMTNVLGYNVS